MDSKALKATKEIRDSKALLMDSKAIKVFKDIKDIKVILAFRDFRALKEIRVIKELAIKAA